MIRSTKPRTTRWFAGTLTAALALGQWGCRPAARTPSDSAPSAASPSPVDGPVTGRSAATDLGSAPAAREYSQVTVSVASWPEIQQRIAGHRGQVVVVDFWSSWCIPCIREFPRLVQLQRQYPDRVACMSVNLNYTGDPDSPPESVRDRVLKFLVAQQATLDNVICGNSDTEMYELLDLGAIPAVQVYDREGRLVRRFDNDSGEFGEDGFTYEDHILPLVEQLLGDESPKSLD